MDESARSLQTGRAKETLHMAFREGLTDRGRAVLDAFLAARTASTELILSCGLLPEVNEACTEGVHHHVHALANRFFDRAAAAERLSALLRAHGLPGDTLDAVDHEVMLLLTADTTAAYLLGLATGIGVGSIDQRLGE